MKAKDFIIEAEKVTFAGKDPNEFRSPKGGKPTMVIQTAQGSRYLITDDGMVLRHKSFHASTGGEDQGLKDWMQHIEFYEPTKIGGTTFPLIVSKAVEKKLPVALSNTRDGKRVLVIAVNGKWRAAKISDIFKSVGTGGDADVISTYSKTPKLNWDPLDYNTSSNGILIKVHPGSPVTHGIRVQGLEEDWKKGLGALLTTGALALSPGNLDNKPIDEPTPRVQQITKPEIKPEIKPEAPKKEVNTAIAKQVQSGLASEIGQTLLKTAKAEGLQGEELAQFLAQCSHETQNFKRLREKGGRLDFKRYDIAHNPRIARALGNNSPGDGYKYIGRGYIHLTGKDNYRRAAKALGIPIDQSPALLERPDIAAKVSVWYWKNRVANKVDDFSNTKAVTKPINSSLSGLEDRHERFKAIGNLLGIVTA